MSPVTDTQVLAVANQKGEVAKTTVASLGAAMAERDGESCSSTWTRRPV